MASSFFPLSDGTSFVEIPDGTDPKDVPALAAQGEAQLADKYGKQAATTGQPVTAGSKVYSATTTYPDTYFGHAGAWLDQNIPGANWAEKNIAQPVENATTPTFGPGGVGATALRIGTNRLTGAVDLPANILNTLKHVAGSPPAPADTAAPDPNTSNFAGFKPHIDPTTGKPEMLTGGSSTTEGDIPTASGAILNQSGGSQLGPDASLARQLLEAGVTGFTPGPNLSNLVTSLKNMRIPVSNWPGIVQSLKNAGWAVSGTIGSDLGGKYFGEGGALLGNLLFGGAIPLKQPAAVTVAHGLTDPSATDTYAAYMRARPITPGGNFQGLTSAPPPGMPDFSGTMPGFKTMANEGGQRIATSLSGVPYVGAPLAQGEANDRSFIQWGRDAAANDVSGGALPADGVNAGTLGSTLQSGAQQAILNIVAEQQRRQQAQTALMNGGGAEVPVTNTVMTGVNAIKGNQRSDSATEATGQRVGELINSSPGGVNYQRADVPLPAQPSVTWSHLTDWVGELNDSLGKSGMKALPDDIANALKDAANADREAAANAQSPGAGAMFRENNVVYAKAQAALDQLRQMAGTELGSSGEFRDVPTQQAAAAYLKSRMQSPDSLDQTLLHPAFPANARLNAAAQIIATLGDTGTSGTASGFRPEAFANQYGGGKAGQRPTIDALLTGQSGQPAGATSLLDNLRTVAEHFSTPTSRFGLIKSLGSAELVRKILELGGKTVEHVLPWKAANYLGAPQIGRGMSAMLESEAVRRAMGGQPQDWDAFTHRAATAASTIDAEQRNRLHYGHVQSGATP